MILRNVLCYAEAILVVFGLDKRKIANREFRRAKIHQKGIIDVDDLLCLGYTEELIAAMLGQNLMENCFAGYFELLENIRSYKADDSINSYLGRAHKFILFKEIIGAGTFFLSYLYTEKYNLSFADMLRAFFNYIDHDINKFEKLTACSRGERRAIDRFIKRGGDPFAELEKEAEHLWNDLIPSFKYFSRRHASASAPDFDDESFLYKELPKRRLLERMGVTKEDAKGTPYEYLFDDVIDLGAILTL